MQRRANQWKAIGLRSVTRITTWRTRRSRSSRKSCRRPLWANSSVFCDWHNGIQREVLSSLGWLLVCGWERTSSFPAWRIVCLSKHHKTYPRLAFGWVCLRSKLRERARCTENVFVFRLGRIYLVPTKETLGLHCCTSADVNAGWRITRCSPNETTAASVRLTKLKGIALRATNWCWWW